MKDRESENLISEVITMEEKYWEKFMKSGLVGDYLHYKNVQTPWGDANRYEERDKSKQVLKSDADSYSDRDGAVLRTDRGI